MEIVSVLRQRKEEKKRGGGICYCLEEVIDPDFTEIKHEDILDNWVEPAVDDVQNDAWVSLTLAEPS